MEPVLRSLVSQHQLKQLAWGWGLLVSCFSAPALCPQEAVLPVLPNGRQAAYYQPKTLQE